MTHERTTRRLALLALFSLMTSCGDDQELSADGGSDTDTDSAEPSPPGLSFGSWVFEHVSGDEDVMPRWPSLTMTEDGTAIVAFSTRRGIEVATRTEEGWTVELVEDEAGLDGTSYPHVIAHDGALHLVYSAEVTGDLDTVLYRWTLGGEWQEPVEILHPDDAGWGTAVTFGAVFEASSMLLGYRCEHETAQRIRLGGLEPKEAPGPLELLLEGIDEVCLVPSAALDAAGHSHLLVACWGTDYVSRYMTDVSGQWETRTLDGGFADSQAAMTLGPDGETVHLVWPFSSGSALELRYAVATDGEVADHLSTEGLIHPSIAADRFDRLILAGTANGEGKVLYKADGLKFLSMPALIPPDEDSLVEKIKVIVDPSTDLPVVVAWVKNQETLVESLWYARFAPKPDDDNAS